MTTQHDTWFDDLYDEGVRAIDRGWNVIPISVSSKKPLIAWKQYQNEPVTQETLDDWFENGAETPSGTRVKPFNLALITGAVSGVLVVDCDNLESVQYAERNKLTSPFSARTSRGRHFYFVHPMNGQRFKNQVGGTTHGWPDLAGLDFRGDGGYVLMPPSVKMKDGEVEHQYRWELPQGLDWDDFDIAVWNGAPSEVDAPVEGEFSFGNLDLETTVSTTQTTALRFMSKPKCVLLTLAGRLGQGDGTDALMVSFCGQKVRLGLSPDDLWKQVLDFHDEFFDESGYTREQTETWLKDKLRSAYYMDKRNHPSDYDDEGKRIVEKKETKQERLGRLRPVLSGDVDRLLDTLGDVEYWADPLILRPQSRKLWGTTDTASLFPRCAVKFHGCGEARLRTLRHTQACEGVLHGL